MSGRSWWARWSCSACSFGWIVPLSPRSSRCSRCCSVQRAQRPRRRCAVGSPQPGQVCQNDGSGRVQVAQSGSLSVPPRMSRTLPQRMQRARRCRQARHHGSPVALEITAGEERPQMAQVMIATGRQVGHSGPSGVRRWTRRLRPQPRHVSWLAGSVTRQLGHSGCPCSSRTAASRMAPHREQGWARDLATQLRQCHCPSSRRCSRMIRWHRGQAGRVMVCAPASQSSSISRSTAGIGACAPWPVSRSGLASMAHAKCCRWPRLENTRWMPALMTSAVRSGSSVLITSVRISSGSRSSCSGHRLQRGRPCRSRVATMRSWPQDAHGLG